MKTKQAFTLIELLVVIAVIAVLAALLLPALSRAKSSAKRAACTSNVRQINLAVHLYADEHGDAIAYYTNSIYFDYKENILPYVGGGSSNNAVFVCAADDFDLSGPVGEWIFGPFNCRGFCNLPGRIFPATGSTAARSMTTPTNWTWRRSPSVPCASRPGPNSSGKIPVASA